MLVLTRRANESLWIGRDIEVKVLLVDGTRVQLGIGAPASTPIWRGEIKPEESPRSWWARLLWR